MEKGIIYKATYELESFFGFFFNFHLISCLYILYALEHVTAYL